MTNNKLKKSIDSNILYSKPVVKKLTLQAKERIEKLALQNIIPGLAVILIGNNPASKIYVKNKQKFFLKNNCNSETFTFNSNVSQEELISFIEGLNKNNKFHGILVQLPLPDHIDSQAVINSVDPSKDVDGFHPENFGYLLQGNPKFIPCTPYGCINY